MRALGEKAEKHYNFLGACKKSPRARRNKSRECESGSAKGIGVGRALKKDKGKRAKKKKTEAPGGQTGR